MFYFVSLVSVGSPYKYPKLDKKNVITYIKVCDFKFTYFTLMLYFIIVQLYYVVSAFIALLSVILKNRTHFLKKILYRKVESSYLTIYRMFLFEFIV